MIYKIINKEQGGTVVAVENFLMSKDVIWSLQNRGMIYIIQFSSKNRYTVFTFELINKVLTVNFIRTYINKNNIVPYSAVLFKGIAWFNQSYQDNDNEISHINPNILGIYHDYPIVIKDRYLPIPLNSININKNLLNELSTDPEQPTKLYLIIPYNREVKTKYICSDCQNGNLLTLLLNITVSLWKSLKVYIKDDNIRFLIEQNIESDTAPPYITKEIKNVLFDRLGMKNPLYINKLETNCLIIDGYIDQDECILYLKSKKLDFFLYKDNIFRLSLPEKDLD